MASNKGMFTSTLWKVLRISFSSFSFLVLANLLGNGGGTLNWSCCFFFLSSLFSFCCLWVVSLIYSSFSVVCLEVWANLYSNLSFCSSFSLLKVTALAFYFELTTICEGSFPCVSNLLIDVATWLICCSRFLTVFARDFTIPSRGTPIFLGAAWGGCLCW